MIDVFGGSERVFLTFGLIYNIDKGVSLFLFCDRTAHVKDGKQTVRLLDLKREKFLMAPERISCVQIYF